MTQPRVLAVIGTRPEAIKMAPVLLELRRRDAVETRIVATAQHRSLLDPAFVHFGIAPDRDLDVMRPDQGLAAVMVRLLDGLDMVMAAEKPDLVLAQGDTSTALAAALTSFYRGIPFGHVEAGLRAPTAREPFPEEMHRRLIAPMADLHFAPTETAGANLLREGVDAQRVFVTGNPGIDALQQTLAGNPAGLPDVPGGRRLLLATVHRRESFGAGLRGICAGLRELAARPDVHLVLPLHPNPAVREVVEAELAGSRVHRCEPFGYATMVGVMRQAHIVMSDSGGVQEEAPALGRPLLVLRDVTERPEGVAAGGALLVGRSRDTIVAAATRLLDDATAWARMAVVRNLYGDGCAAPRIVDRVESFVRRGALG